MEKSLTGDGPNDVLRRQEALSKIVQYSSQATLCPEQELHSMVITVQQGSDLAENEVIMSAQNVGAVADVHHYVDNVIASLGEDRSVGLRRIVNVAAKSAAWAQYVAPLKTWLDAKHASLVEV
jgi:hypothetical protein